MSRAVARIGIRKNKDEVLSNDLHQLGIDLQSGMISSAHQFVRRLEDVRDFTRKAMEATNSEPRSVATMEVTQGLIELHGYLSQQLSRLTLLNRGQVQGKLAWGGQMQWILGVFGWLPTDLDVDAKTFKSDTADLQRMAQLYPSRAHGSYSGVERSAFSPGGIFGSSSSSFSSPNRPAKVCHGCGKPGHILRYCNLQEHQESSLNRRRKYSAIAARPLVTMLENALKGGWVVIRIIRIGQGHSMRTISNSNSSRLPQGWPRRREMYEHRPFSQVAFPEKVF